MTEMSGQHIAGPLAAPCTMWMVAAVPGGFVSVPTTTANAVRLPAVRTWEFGLGGGQLSPETPVQLWNPLTSKVVRTYRIDPGWIYGASAHYLAWRPRSAALHVSAVEITNVATGVTRRIALPLSPGDVAWRDPVLAPHGPYVAWMEVAKANLRKFTAGMTISGETLSRDYPAVGERVGGIRSFPGFRPGNKNGDLHDKCDRYLELSRQPVL